MVPTIRYSILPVYRGSPNQDLDYLAIIIFAPGGSGVIRHQDLDNLAIIIFAPGVAG